MSASELAYVILTPYSLQKSRTGGILTRLITRTGLAIVGIKVHRMSVAQALDFYGPVLKILQTGLSQGIGRMAAAALSREFGYPVAAELESRLGELLGMWYGEHRFQEIIRFMTGRLPGDCTEETRGQPGSETCLALVYEGVHAVRKIREVLGPTDPSQAPPGSIRREFGESVMVNAAHASDSEENAKREIEIVNVAENNFRRCVEERA